VGIFAGGVVFATLLPEVRMNLGGHEIDSFWIGSVVVIVMTGLYTALGGMRAVAYNRDRSTATRRDRSSGWSTTSTSSTSVC